MTSVTSRVQVERVNSGGAAETFLDTLAVEEPLEIRLAWTDGCDKHERPIAVTMRTPGQDVELALGFLWSEGVITQHDQVGRCSADGNLVRVELQAGVRVDLGALDRHVYVSSSCGVCGKASIGSVRTRSSFPATHQTGPLLDAGLVNGIPAALRAAQSVFDVTGGLHAAALFDERGMLTDLREDVGRHNAVDKLVGAALVKGELPLYARVLALSGRASFELIQKATMAGLRVVAAVGAPSSLAVELARESKMTLLGFVRDSRFNVYAGGERITGAGCCHVARPC